MKAEEPPARRLAGERWPICRRLALHASSHGERHDRPLIRIGCQTGLRIRLRQSHLSPLATSMIRLQTPARSCRRSSGCGVRIERSARCRDPLNGTTRGITWDLAHKQTVRCDQVETLLERRPQPRIGSLQLFALVTHRASLLVFGLSRLNLCLATVVNRLWGSGRRSTSSMDANPLSPGSSRHFSSSQA